MLPLTAEATCAVKLTDCPLTDGFAFDASVVLVAAGATVCPNAAELLVTKLESPLYFEVTACEPAISAVALVENVATPPERLAFPNDVLPSKKLTLPVGVPLNAGVTAAVNVTACPYGDGLALEETTAVDVAAGLTVCVSAADALAVKLESPLYLAVIE
jgi:hypothetical protein